MYESLHMVITGSGTILSPVRRQAINETSDSLLPIGTSELYVSKILTQISNVYQENVLKISAKWLFHAGLNVLNRP